jgi:multidrug efflux pump subunit AcrA (membrane-fusion protein)
MRILGWFVICSLLLVIFIAGCAPSKKVDEKKVLFYRNPMNPEITSPVPMKDQMGMDYLPIYEENIAGEGVRISSEQQKLIGVKTEKVAFRNLFKEIRTVGVIAYDPELYVAQEEYLSMLDLKDENLIEAARQKLKILGLNDAQIERLEKEGKAQLALILPQDKTWVYIPVYEHDLALVKAGMPVEIETVAFPGEKFSGKIVAVASVLDPMTRSVKARAEIENPDQKLKPAMYANVKIKVVLGKKLAVVEEAVLQTGKRSVVVLAGEGGNYFSREVKLGQKAAGYYEVLEGLREGERVVTTGNFLIDSEARLKSAAPTQHQH